MTEIILGPPGTGKTTTLIGLVQEELARGTPPQRIGYVSFTRKAASEAMERALAAFPSLSRKDFQYFSTIHSLCFRQLGMKRGDVLEGARLQEFARYAGVRISGRWSEDGTLVGFDSGDRILFMENLARIRGVPLRKLYDQDPDRLNWELVDTTTKALAKFKEAEGLADFTDMLQMFLDQPSGPQLDVLLVDESQDLSHLQWLVVDKLARGCRRVAVAGDDDQAIYVWAGADVDHLIRMRGDVRVLGQSYRVPPVLQSVAGGLIDGVRSRRPKEWRARVTDRRQNARRVREGLEPYTSGRLERVGTFGAADCGTGETLILARNAYVLREQVEPELRRQGIVYERHGHSSIKSGLLEVIRDWERLRRGERVEVTAARAIYGSMSVGRGFLRGNKMLPGREDEELVTLGELRERHGLLTDKPWHEALDRLPQEDVGYIRAARQRGEQLGRPRVVVSTIHGAKGGEADHVVLMKEMAGRTYRETRERPDDERRVWYVGVTRARERLTVVESRTAQACPWL